MFCRVNKGEHRDLSERTFVHLLLTITGFFLDIGLLVGKVGYECDVCHSFCGSTSIDLN